MLAQHFAQNCDLRRGLLHKSKLKGLKNLFSSYLPIYQNLTFLLVQTIADNNHTGSKCLKSKWCCTLNNKLNCQPSTSTASTRTASEQKKTKASMNDKIIIFLRKRQHLAAFCLKRKMNKAVYHFWKNSRELTWLQC